MREIKFRAKECNKEMDMKTLQKNLIDYDYSL